MVVTISSTSTFAGGAFRGERATCATGGTPPPSGRLEVVQPRAPFASDLAPFEEEAPRDPFTCRSASRRARSRISSSAFWIPSATLFLMRLSASIPRPAQQVRAALFEGAGDKAREIRARHR
jgi:hypothetical protein